MPVKERQKSMKRKLRPEIEMFSRKHLLAHSGANLGHEFENGTKAKISAFSALDVLGMLDPSATFENRHTGVDIFIHV